jgi:hypothetical protein
VKFFYNFYSGEILFSRDDRPPCANPAPLGGGGGAHGSVKLEIKTRFLMGKLRIDFHNKNRIAIDPDQIFNRDHDRDENFQIKV